MDDVALKVGRAVFVGWAAFTLAFMLLFGLPPKVKPG